MSYYLSNFGLICHVMPVLMLLDCEVFPLIPIPDLHRDHHSTLYQ